MRPSVGHEAASPLDLPEDPGFPEKSSHRNPGKREMRRKFVEVRAHIGEVSRKFFEVQAHLGEVRAHFPDLFGSFHTL